MKLLKCLLLLLLLNSVNCVALKKFVTSQLISEETKQFVRNIITKYACIKQGFLLLFINAVPQEYEDYVAKTISLLNSTVTVLRIWEIQNIAMKIGEGHVKVALVDPEGELNHMHHIFGQIRMARARIVVICVRKPNNLLLNLILAAYRTMKCLNAVVMYQQDDQVNIFTINPFLPGKSSVVKLKKTDDCFYNKLNDLHGYKINALFTFEDRTKAKSKRRRGRTYYSGKDYDTIHTIFTHMNASLNIIHIEDVLMQNETNPWINSNKHVNRVMVKRRIITNHNISVIIQSQPFLIDDGITENTYPHTQDDDCILVLKGSELPVHVQLLNIFSQTAMIFYTSTCLTAVLVAVAIGRITGERSYTFAEVIVELVRFSTITIFKSPPKLTFRTVVLFGCLSYCFIINLSCQCKLTSILMSKSYEKDIDTIQEFYDSGSTVYAFENQIEEIKKIYSGTNFSDIGKRMKAFPEYAALWEWNRDAVYDVTVSPETLCAFIANRDRAEFLTKSRKYRRNGRSVLHLMRESIIPSYQCFQVEHGSPYLPTINRFLQEAGILDFWARNTVYRATIDGLLFPSEDYEEFTPEPRTLDMGRAYPAFVILLMGYGVASIAFAAEIIYRNCFNYHRTSKYPFVN